MKKHIRFGGGKKRRLWIFFGLLLAFISYIYQDAVATQRHGIEVWNVLWQGKMLDYYSHCYQNTSCAAAYDITIYILFGIWNFPVWIFEKITGINSQNISFFLIYGKGLVVITWLGCFKITGEIYHRIIKSEVNNIMYSPGVFFAISPLVTVYSIYTGNYDILSLFFILLGIYMLFENNIKCFILSFAISISIKYFALWIFILLIIMYEKKVHKILEYTFMGVSISIAEKLIFRNDMILKMAGGDSLIYSNALSGVIHAGESNIFGLGQVSICLVLYIFLCIYCYLEIPENSSEFRYKCIYVCMCAWSIFFMFFQYNSYWIILMIPFMTGLVFSDRDRFAINLILEIVFTVGIYISMNIRQWWIVGYPNGASTSEAVDSILRGIFHMEIGGTYSIGQWMYRLNDKIEIFSIANSVCIAALAAILYINRPGSKVKVVNAESMEKIIYRLRMGLAVCLLVLAPIIYIIQIIVFNVP